MSIDNWTGGSGSWNVAGNWSDGVPTSADDVTIGQGDPQVTSAFTVLSIAVSSLGALTFNDAGASQVTGSVSNSDDLFLDTSGHLGGSNLTIGGVLTNSGVLQIGDSTQSADDSISAAAVQNFKGTTYGQISLEGASSVRALLDVTSAAGFGVAGELLGQVNLTGDSLVEFASGEITTIAASSGLTLTGASAFVADAGTLSSNSALTGLTNVTGTLNLRNGASIATEGALANSGQINLDATSGQGRSSLTIAGALTNSGLIRLGNASLSGADSITVSALQNFKGSTYGTIDLYGGSLFEPTLDVTSAASFGYAGQLLGQVNLYGDSLVEFASGEISTIAANSELTLDGASAFIADAGTLSSNSALTGLGTVTGTLNLRNGASLATDVALVNSGVVNLDATSGDGGSKLTLGGALTNKTTLDIGNVSLSDDDLLTATSLNNSGGTINITGNNGQPIPFSAVLSIASAAALGVSGSLEGDVNLSGYALLKFASGEIATIAVGSELTLNGANAFVADVGTLSSNSALTGLGTVTGALNLRNGASIATSGALANSGTISLDAASRDGGSKLSLGALINSGLIRIGNASLSDDDLITATSLNNSAGRVDLTGNNGQPVSFSAELSIASAAGFGVLGSLEGSVNLSGASLLEFASGEISTIAGNSELTLNGASAFVADLGSPSSNSALTGLQRVTGSLTLRNGASITTDTALDNSGSINLDASSGDGDSKLALGGLTNSGSIHIGNASLSAAASLSASSLQDFEGTTYGQISLYGASSFQATLDVTGAAGFGVANELVGQVSLTDDSVIEFSAGEITKIAARGALTLDGANAFLADSGSLFSNSALAGLAAVKGSLNMINGVSIATNGALANSGVIYVDAYSGDGGSKLKIGGALTNKGSIQIGNNSLTQNVSITATKLVNSGLINLYGNGTLTGSLDVSGSVTNNGNIEIHDDTEDFASAVGGFGSFLISSSSTLDLGSSLSTGETVNFSGKDELELGSANAFAGTIKGFGTGDTIDAATFGAATHWSFAELGGGTAGTLTLTDGGLTAHLSFSGHYAKHEFSVSSSGAGTVITFV